MDSVRDEALKAPFIYQKTPLRPILTSLNGDNSWLLSIPRPDSERRETGKSYFHIVFEPWLIGVSNGGATKLMSWLIHISRSIPAAIASPADICAVIDQIENIAVSVSDGGVRVPSPNVRDHEQIDAIFLGFHYLDHTHEETLRLFDSHIPVIATPEAAALVRRWKYFNTIHLISDFNQSYSSWRAVDLHPEGLPAWLTAVRLPGHHELNYVTAFIWSHTTSDGSEIHEAILQTPHGTRLDEGPLQAFLDSEPATEKLALLHGLKESRAMGSKNTFGARGGLALYRRIGGARFWLLTHHDEPQYSGVLLKMLLVYDTRRDIQWALDEEALDGGGAERKGGWPSIVKVDNGACFVLV